LDRNLFLALALSLGVLVLWSSLQPPPPQAPELGEAPAPSEQTARAPLAALPEAPGSTMPPPGLGDRSSRPEAAGESLEVHTSLYIAELHTLGGGLRSWQLRTYDEGPRYESVPIQLMTGEPPFDLGLVTPLVELGQGNLAQRVFDVVVNDGTTVVFQWVEGGVTVRKTYEFEDGGYEFRLRVDVENRSDALLSPRFGIEWPAHARPRAEFQEQALVVFRDGEVELQQLASLGRGGFFGSLTGAQSQPFTDYIGNVEWAGMQSTYFLAALLPDAPERASARIAVVEPGVAGVVQLAFEAERVPPGLSATREFRCYVGPKEAERLEELGAETIRAIDLGWSWVVPLTRAFTTLLHTVHSVVGNYGVAIILLTVLVRIVTTPLTARQMRSMERMRAVQPKLKEIQEKHAGDKQKQSEAMMSLYRQEKVNPLGGCLPMVLQLPVFIGLFYALRSSIDLRQAPFFGWIDDLSAPETLFEIPGLGLPVRVLPLLMGGTMVLQQRLTPMSAGAMDPAQARMMMTVMPIFMTAIFYQFASGLVLYWMVSNVLAIAHQLWVGRRMRRGK
jgi:YidC/Oxa1 family membrane protein insertase